MDEVERILRGRGSCVERYRERFEAMSDLPEPVLAGALRSEFGMGGYSWTLSDGKPTFVNYDSKGLRLGWASEGDSVLYRWEQVAQVASRILHPPMTLF